jgi:hypothetical protein
MGGHCRAGVGGGGREGSGIRAPSNSSMCVRENKRIGYCSTQSLIGTHIKKTDKNYKDSINEPIL